jgi:Mg2+ and Co2+ transporter CorA
LDEDFAIFLEDFCDFLNSLEDAVQKMKMQIGKLVGVAEEKKYDIEKIKWEKAQGAKGEFERSEDVNSQDFKELLKDVQAHGGKMIVGDYFVWSFKNGCVLGRKPRKKFKDEGAKP